MIEKQHTCHGEDKPEDYIVWYKNLHWEFDFNYGYSVIIEYCPFCGEKLDE
jgi:hypothetical protein